MPTSQTPVVLAILAIIVLAAAGYLLFGSNDEDAALEGTTAPASAAELAFLNLTAQIEPVAFDTSILSDPRFIALQDIRTAILPEPSGRLDPFAPLGGVAATTTKR